MVKMVSFMAMLLLYMNMLTDRPLLLAPPWLDRIQPNDLDQKQVFKHEKGQKKRSNNKKKEKTMQLEIREAHDVSHVLIR